MKYTNRFDYGTALAFILALTTGFAGCQSMPSLIEHKLVVTGNEHSVPMYSDEQTYLKVSQMRQQGGIEGMAGKVTNSFEAKPIDDQTPVKLISTDSNGAVVQITSGPMKGQTGFVAAQNVG